MTYQKVILKLKFHHNLHIIVQDQDRQNNNIKKYIKPENSTSLKEIKYNVAS